MTTSKFDDYVNNSGGNEAVTKSFAESLRMSKDKFHRKARHKTYYDHPDVWAQEVLGFTSWSKQKAIGDSIVNNSFTAVKSCHGAGKSAWAAVIVCWFVCTRLDAGEQVFVITTAPSYPQVHLVLWEEIRNFHAKAKLPGYITQGDSWKIEQDGRTIELAVGRKPADTDENSFQGKHANNLLIVLDEANGIPSVLYTGAVTMLTGDMKRQKMLAIGNPDDPNSQFGKNDARDQKFIANGEEPIWNTIQIKAWDTPNFTEEWKTLPDVVTKNVLQPSWVAAREREWQKDDPRWISKIEAEFPDVSEDRLFSLNLIEQSQAMSPDPGWEDESRIMGVDVARMGRDRTVVSVRQGGVISIADSWTKKSTIETANRIHMKAIELGVTEVRVDVKNMGAGVVDILRMKMGYNYRVIEMDASAKSPDANRWVNARAYWYDNLREQMFMNKVQLPRNTDLENELSEIKYFFKKGALQLEEKAEMKKRLKGVSPDVADSVVFAAADLTGLIPERGEPPKPQAGEQRIIETQAATLLGMWTVSPV